MPEDITSFCSYSKITRKNDDKDINSQMIKNISAFWQTTTPSIEITGGIYDVDVAQYCAEGYTTQETSNGYRVVEAN